eukprot:1185320-Pleurochrysis_carterae.AAC.3
MACHATQRSVAYEESTLKGKAQNSGVALNKEKPKVRADIKTLEVLRRRRIERGWGGKIKRRSTTAPAVRARDAAVATAYERRLGRLLKSLRHYSVLTSVSYQPPPVLCSERHVPRYVVNHKAAAQRSRAGILLELRLPSGRAGKYLSVQILASTGSGAGAGAGAGRACRRSPVGGAGGDDGHALVVYSKNDSLNVG